MRTGLLIGLSLAQSFAIIAHLIMFRGTEASLAEVSPVRAADEVAPASIGAPRAVASIDDEALRRILREELAHLRSGQSDGPTPVKTQPHDKSQDRERRARVLEQIELYRSVGSISNAQMTELQMQIAMLDEASRARALAELARAVNSGTLNAEM